MLKQMIAQSLNGFSVKDLPFLLLQLTISSLLVFLIRIYWRKSLKDESEQTYLNYLIPAQIVFTSIAIFSIKSPWIVVLFGLMALIPLIGATTFSLRSKFFYLISLFIAFGCGGPNLAVTTLVTVVLILPCLHFYKSE